MFTRKINKSEIWNLKLTDLLSVFLCDWFLDGFSSWILYERLTGHKLNSWHTDLSSLLLTDSLTHSLTEWPYEWLTDWSTKSHYNNTIYMGQIYQDGKKAFFVSLFVSFHGDLESKWAIVEPRKNTQLTSTPRTVMALPCFYCKLAQFKTINN